MYLQEIRFDADSTIAQVKESFWRRYGSAVENQALHLKDASGAFVCAMDDDEKTLKHHGAQNGFCIHVVDSSTDNILSEFDDLSKVEKYEISNEDYDKRDNTFRKFKQKMAAENPNFGQP